MTLLKQNLYLITFLTNVLNKQVKGRERYSKIEGDRDLDKDIE